MAYKHGTGKNKSHSNYRILLCICVLCISAGVYGQVTPFQKSVLDSIEANEFNLSVAFAFNVSHDGSSSLTTGTDIGMLYSTRRSNYQLTQSSYFNRLENYSASNRFAALLSGSILSQDTVVGRIVEKSWYPEPFLYYLFDANRGINYRWQLGINAVHAFKPTKIIRIKIGAGLLFEKENWQMIKPEQLTDIPSLTEDQQKYIFDTVGISKNGKLYRDNVRANIYANLMCSFAKNIGLNAFVDVQMPFVPPYHDLPQNEVFPVVTKRYPRITLNMQLTFNIWRKLNFITAFSLQNDKGQIPLYVPNLVYNINEGLQLSL